MLVFFNLLSQFWFDHSNAVKSEISRFLLEKNQQHIIAKQTRVEIKERQIPKDKNDMESFIQGLAHNVPYEYWMHEKAKNSSSKNKPKPKCAIFPSVFDLRFNNK
jgi:hypothetical protein